MRELVILSGKGGTGKTTVAASFAHLAERKVMVDADVDAANLELVLSPQVREEREFRGGKLAIIEPALCTACGRCAEVCRFQAVQEREGEYLIDPMACEGCAVCYYECPSEAIRLEEPVSGHWFISDTPYGPLVHAQLRPAEGNSGLLVTQVKEEARRLAREQELDYLIVDGPPGIGCPVIAATAGAYLALLVTEPTVAGVHDLERILSTVAHFGVPALVCINKYDLNLEMSRIIGEGCAARGIPLVGHIPFDVAVTKAMVQGQPVITYSQGLASQEIERLWRETKRLLDG
ncbi:MAG TPA: (4Fe-4S)-binding protein [Chloroflexi bacterium]|nr:(4Fe-4S)-binding protein [Chloroflexota bacterium]